MHLEYEAGKVVALADRKSWKPSQYLCSRRLSAMTKMGFAACGIGSCDVCGDDNSSGGSDAIGHMYGISWRSRCSSFID